MSDLGNKEIFAKNLRKQLAENNVKAHEVCDALEIKRSTFSDWTNAKSYPGINNIEKLANYFGIEKSDLIEENYMNIKYYLNDETRQLTQELHDNKGLKILLDGGRKLKPKDLDFINEMIDRLNGED